MCVGAGEQWKSTTDRCDGHVPLAAAAAVPTNGIWPGLIQPPASLTSASAAAAAAAAAIDVDQPPTITSPDAPLTDGVRTNRSDSTELHSRTTSPAIDDDDDERMNFDVA